MTLHYSVLASGSTGNAMFIETEGQRLLIDCGLSGKKMNALLENIGKNPDVIDAILVTHEHSDHIKGLGAFSRRHKKPIYANTKTWHAMMPLIGDIPVDQKFIFETGTARNFGDIDVESFGVSHDAAEPMFFNFRHNGKKLTLMTDLGYVSERIKDAVKGADAYVIESNHDIQMLMMGRYPWNVKRRILGDSGHISNEDAGLALTEILDNNTSRIYLAHLSKDNNMKELAKMSVQQKLEQYGITLGHERRILDTDPEIPTVLDTL